MGTEILLFPAALSLTVPSPLLRRPCRVPPLRPLLAYRLPYAKQGRLLRPIAVPLSRLLSAPPAKASLAVMLLHLLSG